MPTLPSASDAAAASQPAAAPAALQTAVWTKQSDPRPSSVPVSANDPIVSASNQNGDTGDRTCFGGEEDDARCDVLRPQLAWPELLRVDPRRRRGRNRVR